MDAREEFIAELYPAARKVAEESGMSWELILAQAAQETGWGQSVLPGTNNIFNIKTSVDWDGESKIFNVWERKKGKTIWFDQSFRVYESIEDSLNDRIKFLRENPRYGDAGLFDAGTAGDLRNEAHALQRAGFATDEDYAKNLIELFNGPTMRRSIALAIGQDVSGLASPVAGRGRVLRPGLSAPAVGELQNQLIRLGYVGTKDAPVLADSHFGRHTRAAVQAFQRDHNLAEDGIAGAATLAAVHRAVETELRSIGQPDAPYLRNEQPDDAIAAYRSVVPEARMVSPLFPTIDQAPPERRTDPLQAAAAVIPNADGIRTLQENLNTLGVPDMAGHPLTVHGTYDAPTQTAVARFQSMHDMPVTGLPDDATLKTVQAQAFIADLQQAVTPSVSRSAPAFGATQETEPEEPEKELEAISQSRGHGRTDPRHPDSPNHDLYNELQRSIPEASEDRLLQFTAACHKNQITADNLAAVHLNEETLTLTMLGRGPLTSPAQVDLSVPPPQPEQAIGQIQQFDQQQSQMLEAFREQNMQLSQGMSR
ncbi:peptidoglycan hydrolase-like protein with peptidoglycan-binding domain [Luteibacter sp. W1I16]|uniref:peptidoglycan-binding protein n=1 Tax=Luteibacter sp. W1I16 TaxID=3373922 RepID=UPI003D1F350F